jgi:hypothetical protein
MRQGGDRTNDDLFVRIKNSAAERLVGRRARETNLALDRRILKKGDVVLAHNQKIKAPATSVVVFADDMPRANWGHPCRYQFYDASTAEFVSEVGAMFPPDLVKPLVTLEHFHVPVRYEIGIHWPIPKWFYCPYRFPVGERYAILYSGASNNRHLNDLEFLYRTLISLYGFKPANIIVLNYDGTVNYSGGPQPATTWPGDNTPYQIQVNMSGTKANFEAAFDQVKAKLKKDDFLLIHTNNHGGNAGPGQSYLVTHSGPDYYVTDFAAKLATLPAYTCLMVMMEQCFAGGFNAPVVANSTATLTSIASAAIETQTSIGGAHFDPFARDWISAMAGHTPSGGSLASNPDTSGNGTVSAREAFNYADSVHDPWDTPNYSESSVAAGNATLARRYRMWWFLCPIFYKALAPRFPKIPPEEFNEIMLRRIIPELEKMEREFGRDEENFVKDLEARAKALIDCCF